MQVKEVQILACWITFWCCQALDMVLIVVNFGSHYLPASTSWLLNLDQRVDSNILGAHGSLWCNLMSREYPLNAKAKLVQITWGLHSVGNWSNSVTMTSDYAKWMSDSFNPLHACLGMCSILLVIPIHAHDCCHLALIESLVHSTWDTHGANCPFSYYLTDDQMFGNNHKQQCHWSGVTNNWEKLRAEGLQSVHRGEERSTNKG